MTGPAWLSAAQAWPIAFAQVREDPRIDAAIADTLPVGSSVLMVASGGCTAALLARHARLDEITVVDPNPAQLALTKLKLELLGAEPDERCGLLGHAAMEPGARAEILAGLLAGVGEAPDALGPLQEVALVGPDHAGRYEHLFRALRARIDAQADLARGLDTLLQMDSPDEQSSWLRSPWMDELHGAFADVLALPNLVSLFGEGATRNPVRNFSEHFFAQFIHLARSQPLGNNTFAWQMLRGRHPNAHRADWLTLPAGDERAQFHFLQATMSEALNRAATTTRRYGIVHLSNILDWLSPAEALATLEGAWACTAPGGWVVIRQLNSSLDIRDVGEKARWTWDADLSRSLLDGDRSFFYRQLHIGRKH